MNICYLCPDLGIEVDGSKGASAHVRGMIRALESLGHNVVVVTPHRAVLEGASATIITAPATQLAGFASGSEEKRLARALAHIWNNVTIEAALRRVLRDFDIGLVYERYSPFGVAGGVVSRELGVPHVLEVNAPLAWEGRAYRGQALPEAAEFLEKAAFGATSLISAVSAELRDILVESGVPASRIAVVPNGVDIDLFTPEGEAFAGVPPGSVVVGFAGGLKPWHGIELVAESFRELASDARFHLLVAGKGPLLRRLEDLQAELPDRVTLTGPVPQEEVARYLRAMDIAVAAYADLERFYFSPLKVLEYMAAGRPVVAAACGQVTELIRHGETGLLVPPGDTTALTAAIRRLAGDTALRRDLGRAAREAACASHTWVCRASRVLELLRGAL